MSVEMYWYRYVDESKIVHGCNKRSDLWFDTPCELNLPFGTHWSIEPYWPITCLRCIAEGG